MEEQNKYISDLLIRYVNGLYTRNDIETLRKLASSITERAELESEMDRVWNEAQDLPQSDSHNHLLYKKEAQDLLDKTRKRERRISIHFHQVCGEHSDYRFHRIRSETIPKSFSEAAYICQRPSPNGNKRQSWRT